MTVASHYDGSASTYADQYDEKKIVTNSYYSFVKELTQWILSEQIGAKRVTDRPVRSNSNLFLSFSVSFLFRLPSSNPTLHITT